MTGGTDPVFVAHRDHPLQEVVDPFPEHLGRHRSRPGQRRFLPGLIQLPGAVGGPAPASGCASGAHGPQNAQVVLEAGNFGPGAGDDEIPDVFDLPVAVRVLAEEYAGPRVPVDVKGRHEGHPDHVHAETVPGAEFLLLGDLVELPVSPGLPLLDRRPAAAVIDAMAFEELEHLGSGAGALGPDVHLQRLPDRLGAGG